MKTKVALGLGVISLAAYLIIPKNVDQNSEVAVEKKKVGIVVSKVKKQIEKKVEFKKIVQIPTKDLVQESINSVDYTASSKKDMAIKKSRFLLAKALKSFEDNQLLNNMLSDKNQIDHVSSVILGKDEKSFIVSNEIKRMDAVAFLTEAISWEENPQKTYAIEAASELIKNHQSDQNMPERLQRSKAADIAELFKALIEKAPASALQIEQNQSLAKNVRSIIQFSRDFYFN